MLGKIKNQERLLRYAQTLPCPQDHILIFEYRSIRKQPDRFEQVPAQVQRAELGEREAGVQSSQSVSVQPPAHAPFIVACVVERKPRFLERREIPPDRPCRHLEIAGEPVGSVFVVKESKSTAKLRLLVVDPKARGRGLGRRLVEECIAFARAKGYRKLVLWTQSNLAAARAIYRKTGFSKVKEERHRHFGVPLVGEYWELKL